MNSSQEIQWVTRWRYVMASAATRPGIWALKSGGLFVRARALNRSTGKLVCVTKIVHGTIEEAVREQDQLRSSARARAIPQQSSQMLWSEYVVSLFEAKIIEDKLKSPKSRERWGNTLARLIPAFGHIRVDELKFAHLESWRETVARWIREGMPSMRKRDEGKNVLVKLSPRTANGWISILKVICAAMARRFELAKDPGRPLDYFRVSRTYTREQPNALTGAQFHIFLAKMRELYPQHYAMTLLSFIIGARPSTIRPLRRRGPEADIKWDEGSLLLRRSNPMAQEIVDETKTSHDQEIPLPPHVLRALQQHVDELPSGPMHDSDFLFPSRKGGMRARSVLDEPFRNVLRVLGWNLRLTPRGMRRTFQDLAREAKVHDVVARAISGHQTERMHHHYSTAQFEEMRDAVSRVARLGSNRLMGVAAVSSAQSRLLKSVVFRNWKTRRKFSRLDRSFRFTSDRARTGRAYKSK